LFTAQIAWVYFSEAWNSSTGVIMEYSFLVKKINFRLGILPVVKMGSALINHAVLILFLFIVLIVNGFYPSFYWFQWLYYLFCIMALALGLSWMTSAVNVFWRDMGYIISIVLQFGFWLTPIFYKVESLPQSFRWILRLNPMYYIVEGYRNSFIYHKGFWTDDLYLIAQYWGLTIAALLVGMMIFKRLRPHFADVI
jgi:lipopolysaccharide transport system permease protein/teichoic acid transport system permease protein